MNDDKNKVSLKDQDQEQNDPGIAIVAQYIKGLVFNMSEGAPLFFLLDAKPMYRKGGHVAIRKLSSDAYECALHVRVKASVKQSALYDIDLVYAGLFKIDHLGERDPGPCLKDFTLLLFQILRRIIAHLTTDAGFEPLLLDASELDYDIETLSKA